MDNNLYDFNVKNSKIAVIICHGFGSSRSGSTAVSVAKALDKEGISSFRFDFPAHGASMQGGESFRMEACLDALAEAEQTVRAELPDAEVCIFASSFGAFTTLLYLAARENSIKKAFLRCTAAGMPEIMKAWTNPLDTKPAPGYKLSPAQAAAQLARDGYVIFEENYDRPLKVTKGFFDDMEKIDLFKLYEGRELPATIKMIHGDCDETAPYETAADFAQRFGIELITVKGADHSFTPEGAMDVVRAEAIEFYK